MGLDKIYQNPLQLLKSCVPNPPSPRYVENSLSTSLKEILG